jgi:hypothetical protein
MLPLHEESLLVYHIMMTLAKRDMSEEEGKKDVLRNA